MENTASTVESALEQMLAPQENSEQELEASTDEDSSNGKRDEGEPEELELEGDSDPSDEEQDEEEFDLDDIEDNEIDVEESKAVTDESIFTVKVDGKNEDFTLAQLKQSASGTAAINRRFQEAAEARKGLEQQAAQLEQARKQVIDLFQQAQNGSISPPTPPDKSLFESDPIGFMEKKIQYEEEIEAFQIQSQKVQQLQQQQQQQNAYQREAHLAEQAEQLKQFIPDLVDKDKGPAMRAELIQTGEYYGWTVPELEGVADYRYVRVLNDAMKYRKLVDKKAKSNPVKSGKGQVLKTSAKRSGNAKSQGSKKAMSKLQQSGSINDAIELMLKP